MHLVYAQIKLQTNSHLTFLTTVYTLANSCRIWKLAFFEEYEKYNQTLLKSSELIFYGYTKKPSTFYLLT